MHIFSRFRHMRSFTNTQLFACYCKRPKVSAFLDYTSLCFTLANCTTSLNQKLFPGTKNDILSAISHQPHDLSTRLFSLKTLHYSMRECVVYTFYAICMHCNICMGPKRGWRTSNAHSLYQWFSTLWSWITFGGVASLDIVCTQLYYNCFIRVLDGVIWL